MRKKYDIYWDRDVNVLRGRERDSDGEVKKEERKKERKTERKKETSI